MYEILVLAWYEVRVVDASCVSVAIDGVLGFDPADVTSSITKARGAGPPQEMPSNNPFVRIAVGEEEL